MATVAPASIKFADYLASNPLSNEHRRELAAARDGARAIRRTARVAAFNGWTTAIIAAFSAPFCYFSPGPVGLVMTIAIAFVAFNEFRGRRRLLNFEPRGAKLLGWNQLGFLAMIGAYCAWMLYTSLGGSGAVAAEMQAYADLDAALGASGSVESLYRQMLILFYGAVVGLSVLFQGGTALYYFSRRRQMQDFIAETPAWVVDIQRATFT